MGRQQNPRDLSKERPVALRAGLTILAAGEQIGRLQASPSANLLEEAKLVALELHEQITPAHLADAGILVIQVDPGSSDSMRRIERVRSLRPDLPQIVALQSADLDLVRTLLKQGVADVVALPLVPEDLLQAAITVLEASAPREEGTVRGAPLIAVTRALGGSGATTLVTHLATAFAAERQSVCLLDLDVQFGRVVEVLGLQPRRTLADVLDAGDRIDPALLHSVAVQHSSGLSVIAAPEEILPLESVETAQLHRALEIARREYEFVFTDMPSNLTNWSLSVLAEADRILMVVEQTIASLRQAKRRLDLFRTVGIESRVVSIVVNRMERRLFGSISTGDVEEALGRKVLHGLHADGQNVAIAQDQGMLVSQVRGKSVYGADITKLAGALMQSLEQGSRA